MPRGFSGFGVIFESGIWLNSIRLISPDGCRAKHSRISMIAGCHGEVLSAKRRLRQFLHALTSGFNLRGCPPTRELVRISPEKSACDLAPIGARTVSRGPEPGRRVRDRRRIA